MTTTTTQPNPSADEEIAIEQTNSGATIDFGNDGIDARITGDATYTVNEDENSVTIDFRDVAPETPPSADLDPITPDPAPTPEPEPATGFDELRNLVNGIDTDVDTTKALDNLIEAVNANDGMVSGKALATFVRELTSDPDSQAMGVEDNVMQAVTDYFSDRQKLDKEAVAVQAKYNEISVEYKNTNGAGGMDIDAWKDMMARLDAAAGVDTQSSPIEITEELIRQLNEIGQDSSLGATFQIDPEVKLNEDGSIEFKVETTAEGGLTEQQIAAIMKKLEELTGKKYQHESTELGGAEEGTETEEGESIYTFKPAPEQSTETDPETLVSTTPGAEMDPVLAELLSRGSNPMLAMNPGAIAAAIDGHISAEELALLNNLGEQGIESAEYDVENGNIIINTTTNEDGGALQGMLSKYASPDDSSKLVFSVDTDAELTLEVPGDLIDMYQTGMDGLAITNTDLNTAVAAHRLAESGEMMAGEPYQDPDVSIG